MEEKVRLIMDFAEAYSDPRTAMDWIETLPYYEKESVMALWLWQCAPDTWKFYDSLTTQQDEALVKWVIGNKLSHRP